MTSMHLDAEQVERALHYELGPAQSSVQQHLEVCAECRLRLAEAEQGEAWVFQRLDQLDHPTPPIQVDRIISRSVPRRHRWERMAAGIALVVAAAGAAYAAPGSPLPGMVHRMVAELQGPGPGPQRPTPTQSKPPTSPAGIAVSPGDRFTIEFPTGRPLAVAHVRLIDGDNVVVHALDGATFTSDVDRLRVDSGRNGARFEIQIPRSARSVEIRVAGRRVFRAESSRVVTRAARDSSAGYRVPLDSEP